MEWEKKIDVAQIWWWGCTLRAVPAAASSSYSPWRGIVWRWASSHTWQHCTHWSDQADDNALLAGVILAHPRLQVVRTKNKRRWDPALSSQLTTNTSMMKTLVFGIVLASLSSLIQGQVNLDFSTATINPDTGALCMMQEVCIGNLEALQSRLPQTPCLDEKCNCASDADCGGGTSK